MGSDEKTTRDLIAIDHRMNIGVLAAVVVQLVAIAWWASEISSRVGHLEEKSAAGNAVMERLVKVETIMERMESSVNRKLERVAIDIDKLEQRGR